MTEIEIVQYYPPSLDSIRGIQNPDELIAKRNEIRDHYIPVAEKMEEIQEKFGPLQEALYTANTRLAEMGINV